MKNEPLESNTAPQGAVELLKADHLRVKRLFARFDALPDGGEDDKASLVAQICQELIVHATLEEEIFYPAVRDAIDDEDQMDEALVEHVGAKSLIAQLQHAKPDDPLYDAKVTVLSEQIDHHVTEEEGSMFPKAVHSGLDLDALGAKMLERKAQLLNDPAALQSERPQEEANPILSTGKRPPQPSKQTARDRAPAPTKQATSSRPTTAPKKASLPKKASKKK